MFNLKMVDTAGGGIKKMFNFQRVRFFPMPEYDLSGGKVKVTVIGKVLDLDFARVLAKKRGLDLNEIIMLDKVQKKKTLSKPEIDHLKSKGLIEGRKPNFHISSVVAEKTGQKAEYIKTRGLKDDHFKKLILEYLDKYTEATREDIDNLLLDILPGVLDEKQRKNKIRNLVYALSKRDKIIKNQGTSRYPKWVRSR
jgi:ATP-dependent DNA helicase RecG